ncbi:hypothetical protein PUN28_002715 [Cardiocondyla obscurior]|uniref:Uncharacterized protein n=1 Tax=Cardiocondyla obscurior TaxID=286306 RepID=A0AAW2GW24_9HYME
MLRSTLDTDSANKSVDEKTQVSHSGSRKKKSRGEKKGWREGKGGEEKGNGGGKKKGGEGFELDYRGRILLITGYMLKIKDEVFFLFFFYFTLIGDKVINFRSFIKETS